MSNESVTKLSLAELTSMVVDLQKKVDELTAKVVVLETPKPATNVSQREMTDDDARRIMAGDLKDTKHKEAGEKLGLSYGQIYSCRLCYTFKHIHKELATIAGYKNAWVK